jgi:hypothetical protein
VHAKLLDVKKNAVCSSYRIRKLLPQVRICALMLQGLPAQGTRQHCAQQKQAAQNKTEVNMAEKQSTENKDMLIHTAKLDTRKTPGK